MAGSSTRRGPRRERGQAVALVVIALVSLLGMAALVLDAGNTYLERRRAQAAADAAALAAAAQLPGTQLASAPYASANYPEGGISLAYTSSSGAGTDTVTATATDSAPTLLARVLGVASFSVDARATAQLRSLVAAGDHVVPWAIQRADLRYGAPVLAVVDGTDFFAPGNFGALDLGAAPGCGSPGASGYSTLVSGSAVACSVAIGRDVTTKTGRMEGPTAQGLRQRGAQSPFDPSTIYQQQPDGTWAITDYSSPNLALIPVVDQWQNGASSVHVVGFAWFIITSWDQSGQIRGEFVQSAAPVSGETCPTAASPGAPCPDGPYDPTSSLNVVELTG